MNKIITLIFLLYLLSLPSILRYYFARCIGVWDYNHLEVFYDKALGPGEFAVVISHVECTSSGSAEMNIDYIYH